MKVIFENDIVKVSETGRDYDFIAVIENKLDEEIQIIFNDIDLEDEIITIGAEDWCGILADGTGYWLVDELKNERFITEGKI